MFVFSVVMMTLVPVVIMPLFNKYEPLPDGVLKDRIYELAGKLNYPLKKLFVMDGSKRSSHSNAFMFGFGSNKRIGKLSLPLVKYPRVGCVLPIFESQRLAYPRQCCSILFWSRSTKMKFWRSLAMNSAIGNLVTP